MPQAKMGDTVKVNYVGTLRDGTIFDSSDETDSLKFKIGEGALLPAFEQAVIGMSVGESKSVFVPASEAYGLHMDEFVQIVERQKFPPDFNPQPGEQLVLKIGQFNEDTIEATVVSFNDTSVTLDINHALAGKDLTFDIQLEDIL